MQTLPPEVLSYIFTLSVDEATYTTFSIRASALRAFALVCSHFRQEAQRLLFHSPVFFIDDPHDVRLNRFLDVLEEMTTPTHSQHLRVQGSADPQDVRLPAQLVGAVLGGSLKAMSLGYVLLDLELLHQMPCLTALALHRVAFCSTSSTPSRTLPQLTDLSLFLMEETTPSCLTPAQLPSLRRLAHHSSLVEGGEEPYSFQNIVELQHRLNFFSCGANDSLYCEENLSLIADKTLFDLGPHTIFMDLDDYDGLPAVKYLRITHAGLSERQDTRRLSAWDADLLAVLCTVKFPALKVLVVPSFWRESNGYNDVRQLAEKRKITLLFEDEETCEAGESFISDAFTKYRRFGSTA